MQELNKETQEWDDKFGIIDKHCGFQTEDKQCGYAMPDSMVGCTMVGNETKCAAYVPNIMKPIANVVIEGVGEDAEVVTNAAGGKQSKSPMAMHLVDPQFLINYADDGQRIAENSDTFNIYSAIKNIALFMRDGNTMFLDNAIIDLSEDYTQAVVRIAKVLQYGADRYEPNNWRLIPEEEHINHALIHIIAHLMGDTQDNHIDHALCRLMMAYSTKKSEDFDYSNYVKKSS
nr:MAG TPA: hypothetical protein [Caudoviricetes sp.]